MTEAAATFPDASDPGQTDWITIGQAAKIFGRSTRTVQRNVRKFGIKTRYVESPFGQEVRLSKADVEKVHFHLLRQDASRHVETVPVVPHDDTTEPDMDMSVVAPPPYDREEAIELLTIALRQAFPERGKPEGFAATRVGRVLTTVLYIQVCLMSCFALAFAWAIARRCGLFS